MKFKLQTNYFNEKFTKGMYRRKNIELEPGFTILVGCNGCGKTTFLKQIENICKKEKIPCLSFDNLKEQKYHREEAGFYQEFELLAEMITSSEGENININLGKLAREIGSLIRRNSDKKEIFILLDAIDSGFSVDNIVAFKCEFIDYILEDTAERGIELYILASANEYELARGEKCFSVYHGCYKDIESYEQYRKLIIDTRKAKNRRYGQEEFEYE